MSDNRYGYVEFVFVLRYTVVRNRTKAMKYRKHINKVIFSINEVYHKLATKLHLSDTAYFILDALLDEDGITQNTLSAYLFTPKQTIHSCVQNLQKKGYISIDEKKKIYLTPHGKSFAQNTVGKVREMEDDFLAHWDDDEREQYIRLNTKYLNDLIEKERGFQSQLLPPNTFGV